MNFKTMWRSLMRDLRSGDLTMLILAVALAVGALSSVSLFADRLSGAFARDAKQLLGGDAVVVSDQPTPPAIEALVKPYGLRSASTLTFPTMASLGDRAKLVALKAVESGYPLRGHLKIDESVTTREIPHAGEVWVERSLLAALDAHLGDELRLGESRMKITHVLVSEPDRGVGFLNFAPRVMMNSADLAATQLVQPASRVTYRLAVIGDQTANFQQEVTRLLPSYKGLRLDSLESGRPETRQVLDTTEKFLHLVALLCALVCAVAVAVAARSFAARRIDDCALRRVLGQSQAHIAMGFAFEFFWVGLAASVLGCALGFGLQQVFVSVLGQVVAIELPMARAWPLVFGLGVGVSLLLGFGLPPVLQLAGTPPLRVLRRDVGPIKAASLATLAMGILSFVALLLLSSKDLMLGLMTAGGFAAALLMFAGLTDAILRLLRYGYAHAGANYPMLRLATRQLLAHRALTLVQVSTLSVGLLALFVLFLLRSDLLANWQKAKPADAPNRIVINILPEQAISFEAMLKSASERSQVATSYDWYPMIRGRLLTVNDEPVSASQFEDERAKRLVEREFNLSHTARLPWHNQLVAGAWQAEEEGAISVEEGLASTLKLKLGDRLKFDVAGVNIESKITSLRKVDWQSMRANFFVLYPKAQMPDLPVTYLAAYQTLSFKTDDGLQALSDKGYSAYAFDGQLVQAFPNITLVDLTQSVVELTQVLTKVTRAVEGLFVFTLTAGMVVLLVTLRSTGLHMQRDFALMRALGASRQQLRRVQALQLAGVGAMSGFLSASVALALAWALAKWVFHFEWTLSPIFPVLGALVGGVITLAMGWWTLRGILRQPVMHSLRSVT